jgi:hypothetical protein
MKSGMGLCKIHTTTYGTSVLLPEPINPDRTWERLLPPEGYFEEDV